jgi:anti-anti-sigma factor
VPVSQQVKSPIQLSELISIDASHDGEALVLRVSGEVCHYTAPTFRVALEGARDSGARQIIIDLSRTTLLAAAGITELARIVARTDQTSTTVRIRGARGLTEEVLRLCGLEGYLERPTHRPLVDAGRTARTGGGETL